MAAAVLTAAHLLYPGKAYAYLDPGSGSFLIQILIATLLGAGVALKVYWKKVKALLSSPFAKRKSNVKGDE